MSKTRKRRICVVTGTRAEYGVLRTILNAISRERSLELQIIATGMHLLRRFGHTVDEIRKDGWNVDARVPMQTGRDDATHEADALGRGIEGISRALRRLDSDIVLVVGDRIEAFAGAAAATCSRRIVAHIHGGDRAAGDVDDILRHAITKLAHLHLVATDDAARRVKKLGEPSWRIHCVGAPGLDDIRTTPKPTQAWLRNTRGTPLNHYAMIVQHPCGRSADQEYRDMRATLSAVAQSGLTGIIVYPNSDPGHTGIIKAIEDLPRQTPDRVSPNMPQKQDKNIPTRNIWHMARSLPRETFIKLLKNSSVLIGNSSCGIIESATAGVPAVDIGPRQKGRLPCAKSVIHCNYGRTAVMKAIQKALKTKVDSDNSIYGDGHAGRRVARILASIQINSAFRQKIISY